MSRFGRCELPLLIALLADSVTYFDTISITPLG